MTGFIECILFYFKDTRECQGLLLPIQFLLNCSQCSFLGHSDTFILSGFAPLIMQDFFYTSVSPKFLSPSFIFHYVYMLPWVSELRCKPPVTSECWHSEKSVVNDRNFFNLIMFRSYTIDCHHTATQFGKCCNLLFNWMIPHALRALRYRTS